MTFGLNLHDRRQQINLSLGLAIVILLTSVHAYVTAQGDRYAGFLLILDHLFNIGLVLALLTVCAAVGLWALTRCRFTFDRPLEALLFSVAVGSGVVAVGILILGLLSLLQPIFLTGLFVILLILAWKKIFTVFKLAYEAGVEIKHQSNVLSLIVLGCVAVFMLSQALLPPTNWDSLMYHLRLPGQLLQAGRLFLPEDNLHIAYVQLAHMLYLPLLAYVSPSSPALLSVFFALFLGLAVFAFARRFFDNQTAAFSTQLLWSSTIILPVAITPRIDVTLALFLFLAHFALLLTTVNWKFFYLSAALLGFAIGVKYTGLVYALALTPVILWIVSTKKTNFAAALFSLANFGVITLSVSLPWVLKNWWLFQAPLYPLFAARKVDPWLAFLYPEKVLPESIDPKVLTMLGEVRTPFNLIDLFVDPSVLTIEGEAGFYRFSPLFLVLIIWLIAFTKNAILNGLIIPPIGYLIVVIVFSSRTNLRYLIPVVAPFTLASVHILVSRLMGRHSSRTIVVIAYLFVLLALTPTAKMMKTWTANKLALDYFIGKASWQDYVHRTTFPFDFTELRTIVAYTNQNLPPSSRVLMLFEARGFYFNIPVIQDNVLTNWPLLAHRASKLNCLAGSGITHVLVNVRSLNSYLERGLDPATVQWDVFKNFADKCLVPVFQGPEHVLYQVRG